MQTEAAQSEQPKQVATQPKPLHPDIAEALAKVEAERGVWRSRVAQRLVGVK
jgi:hypothetical protein